MLIIITLIVKYCHDIIKNNNNYYVHTYIWFNFNIEILMEKLKKRIIIDFLYLYA